MLHILAELAPLKMSDGSRPVLRASSAQNRALNGVAGQIWWPAISKRPTLSIPLFDGDFTEDIAPGSASFTVRMDGLEILDNGARGYGWAGAPVSLYAVNDDTVLNDAGSYDIADLDALRIFKGRVESYSKAGNALTITADVDQEPFEADVLAATYAGTGDGEGGEDLKGRLKPWIFGRALNVEPILVNSIDNVVQFSAYSIQGISALYERGASFGPSMGDYATYEELIAAVIPAGRWATCHARGMARLGAPPYGVITGDVDGDNVAGFLRRTGAIIRRVALARGVPEALIDTGSLDALDAAVPYNINLVLTEQISILDLARRLVRPCNAQAGLDFQGRLFAVRPTIGTPTLTLDAQGRQLPPVRQCQEAEVSAPYKRIMFGANRSWRVHTFDEIAFDAELIDRGDYDPTKTYRRGNIVSMPNGSRWLYVSDTPKAGSEPSEDNPDWELMTGAITAGNITYEDGTPVEALKPAEPGATDGMNDEERDEFDQLAADTAAAQANIAAAQAQITDIEGSFSTSLSQVQGNISDLQSQAAGIIASIGDIDTQVDQISTSVSTLGGSVTTLQQSVSSLEGSVSTLSQTVTTHGASISQNTQAITTLSGSLATLTTRLNASSSPNMCPNGGFENGLSKWNGEGWQVAVNFAGWGNHAYNDADVPDGSYLTFDSDPIDAEGNINFTAAADIRYHVSGAGHAYVEILWYNGSSYLDTTFSTGKAASFNFDVTGANRQEMKVTGLAPANTTSARVRITFYKASGVVVQRAVRQVKMERGTIATPYTGEAGIVTQWQAYADLDSSYSSLSTTVSSYGGSITTLQSTLTNLSGTVSSLSTTVSSQGSTISSLQTATSTLQGVVASLRTMVSASATNIIPYGSFADGLTGWTTAGSWSASGALDASWGRYVSALDVHNAGDHYASTNAQPCEPNNTYTITADIDLGGASGGYAFARIVWLNSSGGVHSIGPAVQGVGGFTNDFSQRQKVTGLCPAGATQFYVQLGVEGSWTPGNVAFRQVKVVNGTAIERFSDEATVSLSFQALSTLNTQYASLSSAVSTQGVSISTQATAITTLNGNVATLSGQYVLDVNVNGVVAGMKLANNGSATSLKFKSDVVEFVGSSTTERFELRQGTIFGYDSTGRKRYQLGNRSLT